MATKKLGGVRYLTFAGGGGKGIVYLGVIKALEEALHGLPRDKVWAPLESPEEVPYANNFPESAFHDKPLIDISQPIKDREILGISGASAGAITAFMLAMGMSSRQIFEVVESTRSKTVELNKNESVALFETFFGPPHISKLRSVADGEPNIEEPYADERWKTNAIGWLGAGIVEATKFMEKDPEQDRSVPVRMIFDSAVPGQYAGKSIVDVYTMSLLSGYGVFTGIEVRTLFDSLLEEQLLNGIEQSDWDAMFPGIAKEPANVTFQRFMRITGVDLVITGTNLSKQIPLTFSYKSTPHFPVAEAVGISLSIPIMFKPVLVTGSVDEEMGPTDSYNASYRGYYVDGGMLNNVPVQVFDHCRLESVPFRHHVETARVAWSRERAHADGLNDVALARVSSRDPETRVLTFYFTEQEALSLPDASGRSNWPSLSVYLPMLLGTLLYSANAGRVASDAVRRDLVEIETQGVAVTDFSNIRMDNRRDSRTITGSARAQTKMMRIINAYNVTLDKLEP